MARCDLYRAREGGGWLLDVQHPLHDHLATRVVAPVLPAALGPKPSQDLNPPVEVEGEACFIFPQYLAAIPKRELGRPVASLDAQRDAITRALDLLFTGF